jgi:beta-lactam-binding protein with PASTA domain
VPKVTGETLDAARSRLALQPLSSTVLYRPAKPGEPPGVVVGQRPAPLQHLSSHDVVTLVMARPLHGLVPDVVGLPVMIARELLAKRGLRAILPARVLAGRSAFRVVSQRPRSGVAAAPGMKITLRLKSARSDG